MPPGRESKLHELPPRERPDLKRTWDLLERVWPRPKNAPELDDAWIDLQRRLLQPPGRTIRRRDRPARRLGSRLRRGVGAAVLLLTGVAAALWLWRLPVTVTAPPGELITAQLPDGSTAQLNSGSHLTYPRRFDEWPFVEAERRTVTLHGEAFFEVEAAARPFVVVTKDARVEVLGTAFNVRSWPSGRERGTEVALAYGRVRVTTALDSGRTIVLEQPGEIVRTDAEADSTIKVRSSPLERVLAWRRRAFAAVDRPIAAILADVERQYALQLDIDEDLALQNTMTLLYGPQTPPEHILHDICLVQGCKYRRTSRGFAVFTDASD